jgi:hypothetical protein
MSYYVPDGNWTSNVANSLGNNAIDVLNFGINRDVSDPAPGCEKIFTASYSCGLNGTAKSLSVDKPADGKTARFDCAAEFANCNDLKLTLTDDGKLSLTNTAGTKKIWDSVTAFGSNGVLATKTDDKNAPITVADHAGNGIANSEVDVGAGGGPGRRYPFNYLLSGQFLESGQWIGSPTGTCRLMMGTSAFPNSLQVVKSVPNCDSLDTPRTAATPAATAVDADTDATRLYTIPIVFIENIGKAGYVNNMGQLQVYPNSMTAYGNNYEQIGNFKSLGGSYKSFSSSSSKDCQDACTSGTYPGGTGDTLKCAGFVFDSTSAMCNLLDNKMYKKKLIVSPTASYFIREKSIINQDISCPAEITTQTTDFWNNTNKNNTPMSPSAKCGLAYHTKSERNTVGSDLTTVNGNVEYQDKNGDLTNDLDYNDVNADKSLYNKNKNSFKYWMDSLRDKYYKLTGLLFDTKSSIKSTLDELQESKQNLADWTGEQLQNLQAMNEDRDLNMMSQNYRHILWSILAIIIIIGTMKMTKANTA